MSQLFDEDGQPIKKPEDLAKEEEEKQKIMPYLKEKRPKFNSLGCGKHRGAYYFGTKFFKDGTPYTAIITDKKEVYINTEIFLNKKKVGNNDIIYGFGLKYKHDFYDEGLDHIFSSEAVKKFCYEKTDHITLESAFNMLVKQLKKYIYFENPTKYKIVALFRIASYFLAVWDVRARLFIYADPGSAKSRLSLILHLTGFNSTIIGDWTLPFIQRMIESTRGEIHIDDYEGLDDEKKKATERLYKIGYMKGLKAGKTEDNTRKPICFDIFNTTTVNNTEGLSFISNDRSITIRIPKISMKEYDKEPKKDDPVWQEIRDNLYLLGLKEARNVEKAYNEMKSDKVHGRLFSIIKPELTVAKLISEELREEIESWWIAETLQGDNRDLSQDWEFLASKGIFNLVYIDDHKDFFWLYDDIVKPIIEDLYGLDNESKWKFKVSQKVGTFLKRNPRFKSRIVNGRTQYQISKEELESYLEAKRWLNYIKETPTSTASFNSTNTTISTYSTNNKKVEAVDTVEAVELKPCTVPPPNASNNDIKINEEPVYDPESLQKGIIGLLKNGKDWHFQEIRTSLQADSELLSIEMEALKEKGDIFEVRPDIYKKST